MAPRTPPCRGELYRRKTLFLDDFPIFFYPNETWTHPLPIFWDFWNFFNFAKPLSLSFPNGVGAVEQWGNSHPDNMKSANTLIIFRCQLNTYLLRLAYPLSALAISLLTTWICRMILFWPVSRGFCRYRSLCIIITIMIYRLCIYVFSDIWGSWQDTRMPPTPAETGLVYCQGQQVCSVVCLTFSRALTIPTFSWPLLSVPPLVPPRSPHFSDVPVD